MLKKKAIEFGDVCLTPAFL